MQITIAGVTPLLCNAFTDAAAMSATNGVRSALAGGDKGSPAEQARKRLYIGLDGKPMIPQPNLFRCFIDAGKYLKVGKSKVTTQKTSIVPACVEIAGVEIPIIHNEPWQVDTRWGAA